MRGERGRDSPPLRGERDDGEGERRVLPAASVVDALVASSGASLDDDERGEPIGA